MIKVLYLGNPSNTVNINLAYIEKYGAISCTVLSDPEKALEWLQTNKTDLVFIEDQVSYIDGVRFFKNARRNNVYSAFMIITAESDPDIISDMYVNGIFDVLVKPFDYATFSAVLNHFCELVTNQELKGAGEPIFFSGISFFARKGSKLEKLLLRQLENEDFCASDLAEKLKQPPFLVTQCLNRLVKSNDLTTYLDETKRIYSKKHRSAIDI